MGYAKTGGPPATLPTPPTSGDDGVEPGPADAATAALGGSFDEPLLTDIETGAIGLLSTAFLGISNPFASAQGGWMSGPQDIDACTNVASASGAPGRVVDSCIGMVLDDANSNSFTGGQNVNALTGEQTSAEQDSLPAQRSASPERDMVHDHDLTPDEMAAMIARWPNRSTAELAASQGGGGSTTPAVASSLPAAPSSDIKTMPVASSLPAAPSSDINTSGFSIPTPPAVSPPGAYDIPTGVIWAQYAMALRDAADPDNPALTRGILYGLAALASPLAGLEELSRRAVNEVLNMGIGGGEHIGRAYLWAKQGDYGEATEETLFSVANESTAFVSSVQQLSPFIAVAPPATGAVGVVAAGRPGQFGPTGELPALRPEVPESLSPTGPSFAGISTQLGLEIPGTTSYRSAAAAALGARAGGLEAATDAAFQSHATAPSVRTAFNILGSKWQSTHVVPQAVYRALRAAGLEVSEGRALTTLLPPEANSAFDGPWIAEWKNAVVAGREIRAGDVYNWVSGAINAVDNSVIDFGVQGAINDRLRIELFGELGLSPDYIIVPARP